MDDYDLEEVSGLLAANGTLTPNAVPDGVPAYGFAQLPTDFHVTGRFTVTTKA